MTEFFKCDGCGAHLTWSLVNGRLQDIVSEDTDHDTQDLCLDCYKATKEFLKVRFNNSKKGINTGLAFPTETEAGQIVTVSKEACQDHNRKIGSTEGSYLYSPRKKRFVSKK